MALADTISRIREEYAEAREHIRNARRLATMLPSSRINGVAWGECKQLLDDELEYCVWLLSDEAFEVTGGIGWGKDQPRHAVRSLPVEEREIGESYGERALEDECAEVRRAKPGERNTQLNRSAFRMGQLVASGLLDEAVARRELEEAARSIAVGAREAESTVKCGIEGGKRVPRFVRP